MFSLLGDGERDFLDCVRCGKKGDTAEIVLKPGDSIGGLRSEFEAVSVLAHGALDRFSDTAESTGEAALDTALVRGSSFKPSA
jgi:hypothetical protein